jgi:hypothetical protein
MPRRMHTPLCGGQPGWSVPFAKHRGAGATLYSHPEVLCQEQGSEGEACIFQT